MTKLSIGGVGYALFPIISALVDKEGSSLWSQWCGFSIEKENYIMPKPNYKRNRDMFNAYVRGNTMTKIATSYGISKQAVSKIISNVKKHDQIKSLSRH